MKNNQSTYVGNLESSYPVTDWETKLKIITDAIPSYPDTGDTLISIDAINEIKSFIQKEISLALSEERKRIVGEFIKWQPLLKDHTQCLDIKSCIGYQGADSDLDNEREKFISLINK